MAAFDKMRSDVRAVFERDPAARNTFEVLLTYPGVHAVWGYRMAHWLWQHRLRLLARWISTAVRFFTGIEIHPAAKIGRALFIDHGMGVVIGETAEIGDNVTIYHGVTLGGVSLSKGKRHPTIGPDVTIGAGAKVLGAIEVGAGARIGANAVVVKPVPPEAVVVGVPGQVVMRSEHHIGPDLDHDRLPDTIGASLASVMRRLQKVEESMDIHVYEHIGVNGNGNQPAAVHAPEGGVWRGQDFMI